MLAGTSGARVYGISGALPVPELDVLVGDLPGAHTAEGSAELRIRPAHLARLEWQVVNELPVTSPALTLVDLAAYGHVDVVDMSRPVERLVGQGWTSYDDLVVQVGPRLRARGIVEKPALWLAQFLSDSQDAPVTWASHAEQH